MKEIATLIDMTLKDFDGKNEEVRNRVAALCKRFPIYEE
jgi:glycine/serine hydroxymethyltransferase